ncbi:hypothetical protein, partial [Mesorhizobium sp.]|uniref:hypothetical protein n=1 Tax=Mesorhizobium sp. TaxID=1871066 RepID=UPI0025FA4358
RPHAARPHAFPLSAQSGLKRIALKRGQATLFGVLMHVVLPRPLRLFGDVHRAARCGNACIRHDIEAWSTLRGMTLA